MHRVQRRRHVMIWMLLAPVIFAGLVVSLSDQLGLDLSQSVAALPDVNFDIIGDIYRDIDFNFDLGSILGKK